MVKTVEEFRKEATGKSKAFSFSFWFTVKEHKFSLQPTSRPIPKLPQNPVQPIESGKCAKTNSVGFTGGGVGGRGSVERSKREWNHFGRRPQNGDLMKGRTPRFIDMGCALKIHRPDSQDQCFTESKPKGEGKLKQSKHTCCHLSSN